MEFFSCLLSCHNVIAFYKWNGEEEAVKIVVEAENIPVCRYIVHHNCDQDIIIFIDEEDEEFPADDEVNKDEGSSAEGEIYSSNV